MKKQILTMLKNFSPLLTKNEAEFLLNITKSIPEQGVILEIGTYKGASAFLLAKGSTENNKGRVYTIDSDIHNLKSIAENIKKAKMEGRIIPITKTSEQAAKNWNKPIAFLFIDAGHGYGEVKKDFLLWEKYLINGGIVALHDSRDSTNKILFKENGHEYYKGPRQVAKQEIIGSKRFKNLEFIDSITYAEKRRNRGFLEGIKNYMMIPALEYYEGIDKIRLKIKKHFPKLYKKIKWKGD